MDQLSIQSNGLFGRCTASPTTFHIPHFDLRVCDMIVTERTTREHCYITKDILTQFINKLMNDLLRITVCAILHIQIFIIIAYMIILPRHIFYFQRITKQHQLILIKHSTMASFFHRFLVFGNPTGFTTDEIINFIQ